MTSTRCLPKAVALLVTTALVTSAWTPDVQAAPARTERVARAHYREGERLFAAGHYEQALAEFQSGYLALPLPGFLIDIGQCHRRLGDVAGARQAYESFLAKAPDSPFAPEVRRYIRELTQPPADGERTQDEPAKAAGQAGPATPPSIAPTPPEAAAPVEVAPASLPVAPASPPPASLAALPRAPELLKNPLAAPPAALVDTAATRTPAHEEPSSFPSESSKLWWVVAAVSILGVATAMGIGASGTTTTIIHDGTLGTLRR